MLINQNNQQVTTQRVILSLLICHLPMFSKKNVHSYLMMSYTKVELRTPKTSKLLVKIGQYHILG